jgi:hypothetical protein
LVEELKDPQATPLPGRAGEAAMERFARQVADRLAQAYAQARFEYLRIAAEPRFLGPLRAAIDQHLDLHRALLEWRPLEVVPIEKEVEALRPLDGGDGS